MNAELFNKFEALTYDEVLPDQIDVSSQLTANIRVNIPLIAVQVEVFVVKLPDDLHTKVRAPIFRPPDTTSGTRAAWLTSGARGGWRAYGGDHR